MSMVLLSGYAKTARLYQAPSQGILPMMGAIAMGEKGALPLLGLFVIGVLLHIFFSMCNEILDIEHDRKTGNLSAHPLASGKVSLSKCYGTAFSAPVLAIFLSVMLFQSTVALFLIMFIIALFVSYLLAKNRVAGTEIPLSLAFGSVVLMGAVSVGLQKPLAAVMLSASLTSHAMIIVVVYRGLWLAQFNSEHDRPTITSILGAEKRGERFYTSSAFVSFAAGMQAVFIAGAVIPFLLGELPFERMQVAFLLLFLLASAMLTYRCVVSPTYRPRDIRRTATVHYLLAGFAFALMVSGITLLAFIIPVVFIVETLSAGRLGNVRMMPPAFATRPYAHESPEETVV